MRKRGNYRPREQHTTTVMFSMNENERDLLHQPAINAWNEIFVDSKQDAELGQTVLHRLHYVCLAAHNYEEEAFLKVLASMCREQLRDYIYRVRLGREHVFSEQDYKRVREVLLYAADLDEHLTRRSVLSYYERIATKLSRDPIFAANLKGA